MGAKHENGVDYYVAATKLLLAQSLLLNATVRATRANQMGLLGFGGDKGNSCQAKLVAGLEYRMKPRNLGLGNEKAYYDAFVAWFSNKHVSMTAAYAVLGDMTVFSPARQRGAYLSVQTGF